MSSTRLGTRLRANERTRAHLLKHKHPPSLVAVTAVPRYRFRHLAFNRKHPLFSVSPRLRGIPRLSVPSPRPNRSNPRFPASHGRFGPSLDEFRRRRTRLRMSVGCSGMSWARPSVSLSDSSVSLIVPSGSLAQIMTSLGRPKASLALPKTSLVRPRTSLARPKTSSACPRTSFARPKSSLTGPKTCGIRPGTSGPDIRTSAKRLGTARPGRVSSSEFSVKS